MPGRLPRTLGALALAIAFLVPAALPVAAREPHRPLPNYHPDFVTQRERGGSTADCLWASASMLVEKWTAGRITVSKDRLRRLSGDKMKGSNFKDLAPVLRRLGLKARWSPEGGEFVTWNEMRARIRAGGGAVLLGDYHELPRWYGRWAPKFWKKKGKKDNHAIYLDRYDGRTDQFWVMDPLAPAGWKGEWIPARYLRSFAWQTGGGGLWVMLTPTAKRAPFSGVKLAPPEAAVRDGQLLVDWKVRKAPKHWKLPRVKVKTRVERLKNPAALGITDWMSTLVGEPAAKKRKPIGPLRAEDDPGADVDTGQARRIRDRHVARRSALRPNRGQVVDRRVRAGRAPRVDRRQGAGGGDRGEAVRSRRDRHEHRKRGLGRSRVAVARRPPRPSIVGGTRRSAPCGTCSSPMIGTRSGQLRIPRTCSPSRSSPEQVTRGRLTVTAPNVPGRWVLTLDLADEVDGSFAAGGSAPRTMVIKIVEGRPRTDPRD